MNKGSIKYIRFISMTKHMKLEVILQFLYTTYINNLPDT